MVVEKIMELTIQRIIKRFEIIFRKVLIVIWILDWYLIKVETVFGTLIDRIARI